jgi:Zn-dependent protease
MLEQLIGKITELLMTIPCVLIALTFHEFAHGFVAYKLGDNTARNFGRLTLNPLKHLDPIGTICMIFFHFGWAKPVPVNARHFKNPRRDMALTALAGPIMNFILAFVGLLICHLLPLIFGLFPVTSFSLKLYLAANMFFGYFHILNLSLGVFNLIPLPPLDGSRIFLSFLPARIYFGIMEYERYIQIAFLVLLWTGIISLPLNAVVGWISDGMAFIINLIPFL